MASDKWRRLHGHDIVAEVSDDGLGAWSARVWLASNATVSVATPRAVETLASAQGKADRLALKTFDHICDGSCSEWMRSPVSESDASD